MRHMSEYGVEGPPEQETNSTKANTHANDKWAQEGTHGPKWKVRGPTGRLADLLVGRLPVGPTDLSWTHGGSLLDEYVGLPKISCR